MKPHILRLTTLLFALAALLHSETLRAQVPNLINYQGRVAVGTVNFNSPPNGLFKFALVNAAGTTTYWSNDGTSVAGSQPTAAVALTVTKGLYSVLLGDTSPPLSMTAIPASVFNNTDVRLRVWFDDGVNLPQLLTPDQRIAAVGYAVIAGGLALPTTAADGTGAITVNGSRFIHSFGTNNFFAGRNAGNLTMTGNSNTVVGNTALLANTTGSQNTAIGANGALGSNLSGNFNVAIGDQALAFNVAGNSNTGVGFDALLHTTANNNTAVGQNSLVSNTSGTNNIAIGQGAGFNLTTGSGNIEIGNTGIAGESNMIRIGTAGTQTDTFLTGIIHGDGSGLTGVTAGSFTGSLAGNVTGTQGATVVATVGGSSAASVNAAAVAVSTASALNVPGTIMKRDGAGNVTLGTVAADLLGNASTATTAGSFTGSLAGNVTGTQSATVVSTVGGVTAANVASGSSLANAATSANTPNAIVKRDGSGSFAGGTVTLAGNLALPVTSASGTNGVLSLGGSSFLHAYGSLGTFLGATAGNFTMTGAYNTGLGYQALSVDSSGEMNTAVGAKAMSATTTGFDNTAIGSQALRNNISGVYNTAVGTAALYVSTDGYGNTATGYSALTLTTSGDLNEAAGFQALALNTVGNYNTANGANALFNNTAGAGPYTSPAGDLNTANGYYALFSNESGGNNTVTGANAVSSNPTGSNNTAFGAQALMNLTTGDNNLALGYQTGISLTSGSNNVYISSVGAASENNAIRIGGPGFHTKTFIAAIRGVTTGVNNAQTVLIDSNGQLGTASSSRRYKEDIADMADASARLYSLRPVTFRYRKPFANGEKPIQFGLIAEEVADAFPELTVFNAEGEPESVKYHDLAPLLLNEFLKDHSRALEKDAELKALRTRVAELEEKDRERDARLARLEQALPPAPRVRATTVALQPEELRRK